jgi:hypothetical protein
MQAKIYYGEEYAYLVRQVGAKARRERKSRSAVIPSILEELVEREILIDLGAVSRTNLAKSLELRKSKFAEKLIGDILLEEELVEQEALDRALNIQAKEEAQIRIRYSNRVPSFLAGRRHAEKGKPSEIAGCKAVGLMRLLACQLQE